MPDRDKNIKGLKGEGVPDEVAERIMPVLAHLLEGVAAWLGEEHSIRVHSLHIVGEYEVEGGRMKSVVSSNPESVAADLREAAKATSAADDAITSLDSHDYREAL